MGLIRHRDFIYLILTGSVWLTFTSLTIRIHTQLVPPIAAIQLSLKTTKIHAIFLSTAFQFSYRHTFPTMELQAACHPACGVPGLPFREASPTTGWRKNTRFISGIGTPPTLAKHRKLRYQCQIWGHQRSTVDLLQGDPGTSPRSLKKFVAEQRVSATSLAHLLPQKMGEWSQLCNKLTVQEICCTTAYREHNSHSDKQGSCH